VENPVHALAPRLVQSPFSFKPYYVAHTKIRTLALLDEGHKGTNWLQWRTRLQPIRTASEIEAHIKILPARQIPLYQKHAQKATELHLLGMTQNQIAKTLNVSLKTIKHALASVREAKQRNNPTSLSSPRRRGSQSSSPVIPESTNAPLFVIPESTETSPIVIPEFPACPPKPWRRREGKYPGSKSNKKRKET